MSNVELDMREQAPNGSFDSNFSARVYSGFCKRFSSATGMWHRIRCPSAACAYGGSSCSQIAPILRGQRVWNTHPEGGFAALGNSPERRMRSRAWGSSAIAGIDDNNASV